MLQSDYDLFEAVITCGLVKSVLMFELDPPILVVAVLTEDSAMPTADSFCGGKVRISAYNSV